MASESTFFLTGKLPVVARKIKKAIGRINILNYTILVDKIIIQGILHKQVFFIGADGITRHVSGDIPFKTMLYIPGARPGMNAIVFAELEKIKTKLSHAGENIFTEAIVKVTAIVEDVAFINMAPGSDETILAELVMGYGSGQGLVENTIDLKSEAKKITEVNSKVVVRSTELIEGKVLIEAVFRPEVYYVGEDDLSHYQAFEIPLSEFIEIGDVQTGMKVYVEPAVEMIETNLISPKELFLKAMIGWNAVVIDEALANIGVSPSGQNYRVNVLIGQPAIHTYIEESRILLKNEALKVREIRATVSGLSTFIVKNKVIIQGILHKQIYYVGFDGVNRYQEEDLPFFTFLDYEGVMPGQVARVKAEIEYTAFTLLSPREILQKNIIVFNVMVTESRILPVILGTGSTVRIPKIVGETMGQVFICDTEPIAVEEEGLTFTKIPIVISTEQKMSKQTQIIRTVDIFPPAVELGESQWEVKNIRWTLLKNQLLEEGDVSCNISYVGLDGQVYHINVSDRFSVLIPLEEYLPSDEIKVSAEIEHAIFDILPDGGQITLNMIVRATVRYTKEEIEEVIIDLAGPGITVDKLLVRAKVPTGETIDLYVVTEVYGVGINVKKKTLILDVVGEGPRPVDVVVDAWRN
ncbi:MAG: hypothetical protein PWP45_193 [Tepidanaerobacteraceae bacterium]|nr:hypothetical protein [Tepidanaerobacteraceae bacterium]